MEEVVRFTLNGKPTTVTVDSDRKLLWVLRTDLELTGPKYGCGEGHCGACTVLVDERAVRSCTVPAKFVQGKSVTTIEGLSLEGEALHPLQKAFAENDALQCGFCTPGMILTAYSFLRRTPDPTDEQIRQALEYNLCRCGAHKRIVEAVKEAAQQMREGS